MTRNLLKMSARDVRLLATLCLAASIAPAGPWLTSDLAAKPNQGGGNGGGGGGNQTSDRTPLCAELLSAAGNGAGVFHDERGSDYCDSEEGLVVAIGPDGGFRMSSTGPRVANSENRRTLTVVCDSDGNGTNETFDSGPFDMRSVTEWVFDE
ncbi:MAG: hypothetical protein KDA61_12615, partial [Planctomycetales bacterium]|nr:hypothetical protein [Planctomycetales bacterium]